MLRQKLSKETMRTTAPLLEAIIRQGCEEAVFDTDYPREAAAIITGMGVHLADAFIDALEADGAAGVDTSGPHIRGVLAARTDPRRAGRLADTSATPVIALRWADVRALPRHDRILGLRAGISAACAPPLQANP
jgi:hypothetical protein